MLPDQSDKLIEILIGPGEDERLGSHPCLICNTILQAHKPLRNCENILPVYYVDMVASDFSFDMEQALFTDNDTLAPGLRDPETQQKQPPYQDRQTWKQTKEKIKEEIQERAQESRLADIGTNQQS